MLALGGPPAHEVPDRPGARRPRGRDARTCPARASRSPRCATWRSTRRAAPIPVRVYRPGGRRAAAGRRLPARRRLDARLDRVLRHGGARAGQRLGRDRGQRRLPARARGAVPGRPRGLPVRGPLAGRQRRPSSAATRARLAIAGDSAGGNLADGRRAARCAARSTCGMQALIYPVTDAGCNTASYREFGERPRAHRRLDAALLEPLPRRLRRPAPGRLAAARGGPRGLAAGARAHRGLRPAARRGRGLRRGAARGRRARRRRAASTAPIHGFWRWLAVAKLSRARGRRGRRRAARALA